MKSPFKVLELDGFAKFSVHNNERWNAEILRCYLCKAVTIPSVLSEVKNPEGKKFMFRLGENRYESFCFQNGEWYKYKRIDDGFYDFHTPMLTFEEYLDIRCLRKANPKLFSKIRSRFETDCMFYDFQYISNQSTRWSSLRAHKRFLEFCAKRDIPFKVEPLPLP